MASQVGGDLSRIETGPCKTTYKAVAMGHTLGGVKFNIQPDVRKRVVDEYGTYTVEIIHTGEQVSVTAAFPEKTIQVIQTVYQWGYSISATLWGIGRNVGSKGSTVGGVLLLHPLDAGASTADDVTFHKAVVESTEEVEFGTLTADRVFGCTFGCMFDESKTQSTGLLGTIGVGAT